MAACVSVCDYECVLEGLERGVLSVLSHTEKIKVLMARASSNGTLSCVCACVHVCMRACVCLCVRPQSCIQIVSYSWPHYIQAWSFFLFTAPSFSTYMWASIHIHWLFSGCRAARISPKCGDSLFPAPHPTCSSSYHTAVKVF